MADTLVAKDESKEYEKPEPGQYTAVCVDIVDLGMQEETYDDVTRTVHKCAIVFQLDALNKEGKRFEIAPRFTVSMHKKANLRKFLEDWRGRPYSDEQAKKDGAPLHVLEGVNAYVQIVHRESNGKVYANIGTIMAKPSAIPSVKPLKYTRSEHWKKALKPESNGNGLDEFPQALQEEDDDLPF
jgi:hypothetical protein